MSMRRRLGCHPFGLDRPTARLVIRTMCDEISISNIDVDYRFACDFDVNSLPKTT